MHYDHNKRRPRRLLGLMFGGLIALLSSTGIASAERGYTTWYGPGFHGNVMAGGGIFDENDPTTTASNQFPFGTWLRVTNPANGRTVYVQVRDRGGFGHALDLSKAAFFALQPPNNWGFWVDYEVVPGPGQAPARPAQAAKPAAPKPATANAAPSKPAAAAKPAAKPSATPTPLPATASEHVVDVGDTLRSISRRHDLALADLIAWNGIEDPDALQIGQRLRLIPPVREYVVERGDTLNGIAAALGVSRATILDWNGLDNADHLRIGQKLVVPN